MKKYRNWIPVIINTVCAIIALLFYNITHKDGINYLIIIEIAIGTAIPFILIFITHIFHIKFPFIFHIAIVILIIMALYLGNGFSFYSIVPFYDKLLHTYFGFISSVIIFCTIIYYGGDTLPTTLLLVTVFFFSLGLGGVWEMFEYLCDIFTGGDALRVQDSINQNLHPFTDTILDLFVTEIGVLIFYLILLIDKFNNFSLTNKIKKKIEIDEL